MMRKQRFLRQGVSAASTGTMVVWNFGGETSHPSSLRASSEITSVVFDQSGSSIYYGNALGDVVHQNGVSLAPISYFRAHDSATLALSMHANGVLSLSQNFIRLHNEYGMHLWSWRPNARSTSETSGLWESPSSLRGPLYSFTAPISSPSNIFVGTDDSIYSYSLRSGAVLSKFCTPAPADVLATSDCDNTGNLLYLGTTVTDDIGLHCATNNGGKSLVLPEKIGGWLNLLDTRSGHVVMSLESHSHGVTSIAASGDLVATSGRAMQHGVLLADGAVRIYDIRAGKMVFPVMIPMGAEQVRIGGKCDGEHPVLYALNSLQSRIYGINLDSGVPRTTSTQLSIDSAVRSYAVAPDNSKIAAGFASGSVLIYHDEDSIVDESDADPIIVQPIHMLDELCHYSNGSVPKLNSNSNRPHRHVSGRHHWSTDGNGMARAVCFADAIKPNVRFSAFSGRDRRWNQHVPLFSQYLFNLSSAVHASLNISTPGLPTAPNTRGFIPNMVSTRALRRSSKRNHWRTVNQAASSKGHSDSHRGGRRGGGGSGRSPTHEQQAFDTNNDGEVDEDDDGSGIGFVPLDADVKSPYVNQIVRLFCHLETACKGAIAHMNRVCDVDPCLVCELGLLFKSLRTISTVDSLHITHLLRSVPDLPHRLGEQFDATPRKNSAASSRATLWHQLYDVMSLFLANTGGDLINGVKMATRQICRDCNRCQESVAPLTGVLKADFKGAQNLSQLLNMTAGRRERVREWCDGCNGFRDVEVHRYMESLPEVIMFSVDPAMFKSQLQVEASWMFTGSGDNANEAEYTLKAIVVESIEDDLVDLRVVVHGSNGWMGCRSASFLPENDISLLHPLMLVYERASVPCISAEEFLLRPVHGLEHLNQDSKIGLDGEFVAYERGHLEFSSDGSQRVVKPKKMRLARLSLVNCADDSVILDDFIALDDGEVIEDYCTEFSGIRQELLTRGVSQMSLVSRKDLMLRLQSLIDAGCVFIGHGIDGDFEVCNLICPPNQMIDTVSLFYLRNHRRVSMRFLYWFFFRERIQTEAHDSVDDCRAAIRLYKHYASLRSKGGHVLKAALTELFNAAACNQGKVPDV